MRIVNIKPSRVYSYTGNFQEIKEDSLFVGKCIGDIYFTSMLNFAPIFINEKERLVKATLKLCCKNLCGSYDALNLCINKDDICADIFGPGNYTWDITELIRYGEKLDLSLFITNYITFCSIREFEPLGMPSSPTLELILDDANKKPDYKITDIIEDCVSTEYVKYTKWIDCTQFDEYYFFIKNLGYDSVDIIVEISPDRHLIFQDVGPVSIKEKEVNYQQPLRSSKFVRIQYKNTCSQHCNPLEIFFQGKR